MASYMEPSNLIEDLLEEGYCKPSFPGACAPGSLGDHSTLIVSVVSTFWDSRIAQWLEYLIYLFVTSR